MTDEVSFLDAIETLEKEEGSGNGYVCKFGINFGYKLFVSGMSNEDSFFKFSPNNDASKKEALGLAKKALDDAGITGKKANASLNITIYKDKVLDREVTWVHDRQFVYPLWTDGYKQVVKKSIKDAGVTNVGDFWGRIKFTADPSGRTEFDQEGKERAALIAYVAELYASEEDARKVADSDDKPTAKETQATLPSNDVPDGWTQSSWDEVVPDIKAELQAGATLKNVADDYGVPIPAVKKIKDAM